MLYLVVVGLALLTLGALNLLFATRKAPPALEPLLGATGRRLRAAVAFFPADKQEAASRVVAGIALLLGGGYALFVALQRLGQS